VSRRYQVMGLSEDDPDARRGASGGSLPSPSVPRSHTVRHDARAGSRLRPTAGLAVPVLLAAALGGGVAAVGVHPPQSRAAVSPVPAGEPDGVPRVGLAGAVDVRRPVALFIGDSYAAGSGGTGVQRSFACLTARAMGWVCRNDGEPGTGYTNPGKPQAGFTTYARRALRAAGPGGVTSALATPDAHDGQDVDVVVVTGGRNDSGSTVPQRLAAAGLTLDRLRVTYPEARIVVVGPFWVDDDVPPSLLAFDAGLREEARTRGLTFVDPIRERWLTTENRSRWIAPDEVHPTPAGHQRIATMLVAGLEAAGIQGDAPGNYT
jgi:acyl-CoA thioesterase-1